MGWRAVEVGFVLGLEVVLQAELKVPHVGAGPGDDGEIVLRRRGEGAGSKGRRCQIGVGVQSMALTKLA